MLVSDKTTGILSHQSSYLRTVFSLPVCETQMQWSMLARENLRKVFVTTADTSAKPNSEWSVNTVAWKWQWKKNAFLFRNETLQITT